MSEHNLKSQAESLEALLAYQPPARATDPVIDESYLVAADPVESPEAAATNENDALLPELVRSIVDYAVRRAPATATAKTIGEAIGEGVHEAVSQLKLDDVKVVNAVDVFLSDLCQSVRNKLSME
jgi:hypothetical protein